MIFAGNGATQASEKNDNDLVVYHTGSEPSLFPVRRGFALPFKVNPLRIIRAYELENAADPVWLPKNENNHFLGVYQWLGFEPSTSKSRHGVI